MPVSDFTDLMTASVTHIPLASLDSYGAPTYGAGTVYSARVVYKTVKVKDSQGEEIDADGVVWLLGNPDVKADDQIQLPDSSTPVVITVERPQDEIGLVHHTKVYFGG